MVDSEASAAQMKPMNQPLARKIAAAQARYRAVALGTGAGRAAVLLCAFLVAVALVDWRMDLSRAARVVLALAAAAAAIYVLLRYGLFPAVRGLDEESVALAVERMDGRFGTRLIAAVQLARPGAVAAGESTAVVAEMLQETETAAAEVDFRRAINASAARRAALWAGILVAAGVSLYIAGGEHSRPLLLRALGAAEPWPSRTRVQVTSGSFLVAIGDPATLTARAGGYRPNSGIARIVTASGRRQSITLSRISDDQYAGTLQNVAEPFSYSIQLYDNVSGVSKVDAQPRPVVTSLACTQIYPAYTGVGDAHRELADLFLLSGSRLQLRITVNRPLRSGASRLLFFGRPNAAASTPLPAPLILQPDPKNDRVWNAEFQPTAEISGFSIHLVDQAGLESRNEPVFPVHLTSDAAPTIRMIRPQLQQALATADAVCSIAFAAEDDYGLAGVSLRYRIDQEPEVTVPFSLPPRSKELHQEYAWHLSALAPPPGHPSIEGSVLDFYIEAHDNNPASPGIATSEHYQIRVVSKAEKQAELIARMAASFAGIQELSDEETKAAADLRAASLPPAPASQTQPGGH
jgi:hypothetical protein